MRLAGALLGFLIILTTGGCDGDGGTGENGGGGTAGIGATGGIGGGGSGGTAVTRVWHGAVLIEQDDVGDAQEPRLAGSRAGNAVVVWLHLVGERNDVWANTHDTATGWQAAQPIEQRDGDADAPRPAMSPDGRHAMAVWSQPDEGTIDNVWVNRYEGLWRSQGTILDLDNGWLAGAPQVVMYPGGAAKVVWIEQFRLERAVWANRFTPNIDPVLERWWGAERIDDPGTTLTDTDELVLVGYGDSGATAAWREEEELIGNLDFWSSHYDAATGQWAEPELVETLDGVATAPRVSLDADGNAIAVWRQRDDTLEHYDIWANRWAPRP
mgnify:FL=1